MGHTNQLIALSEELACRGYTISIVIHPTAKAWVTNHNIQFIPWKFNLAASDDEYIPQKDTFWHKISQEPHPWRSNQLMLERVIAFYRPMYESLKSLLQEHHPDCLVIDRAVVPAIDLAIQQQLPFIIQTRFLGNFVKPSFHQPQFGTDYKLQLWTEEPLAINSIRDTLYRHVWEALQEQGIEMKQNLLFNTVQTESPAQSTTGSTVSEAQQQDKSV